MVVMSAARLLQFQLLLRDVKPLLRIHGVEVWSATLTPVNFHGICLWDSMGTGISSHGIHIMGGSVFSCDFLWMFIGCSRGLNGFSLNILGFKCGKPMRQLYNVAPSFDCKAVNISPMTRTSD